MQMYQEGHLYTANAGEFEAVGYDVLPVAKRHSLLWQN
jgi:hypothetical protein